MKKILLTFTCLFSMSLQAATNSYDLNLDLSLQGKLVLSPHVVLKEGEKKLIKFDDSEGNKFIEVAAKEDIAPNGKSSIHMKFVVGKIAADGTKTIIAAPQIMSLPNQKAQISLGENGKEETLSLSVIANKVAL